MTEEKTETEEKTFWALDLSLDLYDCDVDKFNISDIH